MPITKRHRHQRGVKKSRRVKKVRRSRKGRKGMRKSTKRRTHRKYQRGGVDPDDRGTCFDLDYYSKNQDECEPFMYGLQGR